MISVDDASKKHQNKIWQRNLRISIYLKSLNICVDDDKLFFFCIAEHLLECSTLLTAGSIAHTLTISNFRHATSRF